MWNPNKLIGFEPGSFETHLGFDIPYSRPGFSVRQTDPRVCNPQLGGGRRMVHPYFDDIVYPENPTRTPGFDYDAMRAVKTILTRTEGATALTRYPDNRDDVIITEVFDNGADLKISVEFVRELYRYLITPLPVGDYIGWHCPDKSPFFYFIELIDVKVGSRDQYNLDEIGSIEPYMLTEPLTIVFKLVQAAKSPAGVLVFLGH